MSAAKLLPLFTHSSLFHSLQKKKKTTEGNKCFTSNPYLDQGEAMSVGTLPEQGMSSSVHSTNFDVMK